MKHCKKCGNTVTILPLSKITLSQGFHKQSFSFTCDCGTKTIHTECLTKEKDVESILKNTAIRAYHD